MGLSKSKTKTVQKNDPWGPAQPYILKNLQQQDDVFTASQPQLMGFAGQQRDTYGRLAPGAELGISTAQNLVNRNLSGANLQGNPYLDAILGQTRDNVAARVGDEFGTSGRFGGGMHQAILEREMANAENNMRYQDYSTERGYQQQAINDAQSLMGGSQSLLNNAAELPWIGVQAANGAVRQASNGYGTTTSRQTSSPGLGQMLMQAASAAAQAYAASDPRLKTNIERIGEWDDRGDGLGKYRWNWKSDPNGKRVEGVLSTEVQKLRPWAFVPRFTGEYDGVNYAALSQKEVA